MGSNRAKNYSTKTRLPQFQIYNLKHYTSVSVNLSFMSIVSSRCRTPWKEMAHHRRRRRRRRHHHHHHRKEHYLHPFLRTHICDTFYGSCRSASRPPQCDQMAILYFIFWPFTTMKNCQIA